MSSRYEPLTVQVPDDWTPEQALAVYDLLHELAEAIWDRYEIPLLHDGDRGPEPVDELGIELKKPVRNYGNESNYQYGIKAGAPRVMSVLDKYGVTATFTAAAAFTVGNVGEEVRVLVTIGLHAALDVEPPVAVVGVVGGTESEPTRATLQDWV